VQYVLTDKELKKLVPGAEHDKMRRALEWVRKRFAPRCIYGDLPDRYGRCDECPLGSFEDGPPKELRGAVCSRRKEYSK